MKRRIAWALFTLLFAAAILPARIITGGEARQVAVRLLDEEGSRPRQRTTAGEFRLDSAEPLIHRGRMAGYLVRMQPGGFMIMGDISEAAPQVFISFDGDYAALYDHPFMIELLDRLLADKINLGYLPREGLDRAFDGAGGQADTRISQRNESRWNAWLNPGGGAVTLDAEPVGDVAPLTRSRWNQAAPYWNYTPRVEGTPTYTGCSATAMAQVMYFWKYPARGQGSHSYSWNGQTLSADFAHDYYWDRMIDSYSSGYTAEQADAVARLMSDVGIAINMNYGTGGSGAVPNANDALFSFFKYSGDEHFVFRSSYADWSGWFDVFKGQADIGRPAILATFKPGSGHAVVIDGYRTSPSSQVHVNMGWGGSADNYYDLSNVYGYGSTSDYAVVDIYPGAVPVLHLGSPDGGESWITGSSHAITWTATAYTGLVRLVLYDGNAKVGQIAGGLSAGAGTYSWTVGQHSGGTAPAGANYRVRIVSNDGTLDDWSDAAFAITEVPALAVASPNGGENWTIGSSHAVTWTATAYTGLVRLVLYDGNAKVGQIAGGLGAGAGTYSWTVGQHQGGTAPAGASYRVRIVSNDGTLSDWSDAFFALVE